MEPKKKLRFSRIVARLKANEKMAVIALDEGVTVQYVSMVRTRAGLPRRVKPREQP